ncbi:MAG: hypothetical protein BWY70_01162 [Bacteroidetes bacterium ADurb.Bin408]|nr:MAG: hypothetical protein BWY70_01162 [Bacteroidetes bacterium ADurb.Bin408]
MSEFKDIKDKIYPAYAYSRYLVSCKNAHGIHSPFVFDLYNNIIASTDNIPASDAIEDIRLSLLNRKSFLDVFDFGTGKDNHNRRRIKDITSRSISNRKKCALLYKMAAFAKPESIIELGTSFGIATMYMALATPEKPVYTIEGCAQSLAIAKDNFNKFGIGNIHASNATFDVAFPDILKETAKADFIYFDGNHFKEPTLRYFNMALPYAHNDSIFIFDDIHWSYEMEAAWDEIRKHPQVTVAIDLFYVGILFFRKELSPQTFVLKF